MRMIRRMTISLFLVFSALVLTCCGQKTVTDGVDYNQYIYHHGSVAYTDDAYIFCNNGSLTFLEPTLSAPISPLCTRPNCMHRDGTCAAHINSQSVFASGNKLYYLAEEEGAYGVYEVGIDGGGRKRIKELPVLSGDGFGFSHLIRGEYVALAVERWSANASSSTVYLTKLRDPNGEIIPVLGGDDNTTVSYDGITLWGDWLLAEANHNDAEKRSLVGYHISAGEACTLIEDWSGWGNYAIRDDTLYWFDLENGFYSMSLTTMEQTKYRECDPAYEYGAGMYDNEYLYFTNAIPMIDRTGRIPADKRGLYIYTYEGELKQFIPVPPEENGKAMFYLLSTPSYVFFTDGSDPVVPVWYLEKADIASGGAKLVGLE